jgi:hypothetical protein
VHLKTRTCQKRARNYTSTKFFLRMVTPPRNLLTFSMSLLGIILVRLFTNRLDRMAIGKPLLTLRVRAYRSIPP